MHNFKELKVWQMSRQLVKKIYELSATFPSEEKFGIISQVRRCAVSIPTNIAEGCGRSTDKDFTNFLNISLGSAYELESLLYLCYDLELIPEEKLNELLFTLSEIQKMSFGLIKTFRQKSYV